MTAVRLLIAVLAICLLSSSSHAIDSAVSQMKQVKDDFWLKFTACSLITRTAALLDEEFPEKNSRKQADEAVKRAFACHDGLKKGIAILTAELRQAYDAESQKAKVIQTFFLGINAAIDGLLTHSRDRQWMARAPGQVSEIYELTLTALED